jgi:hypothetical protein
LACSDDILEPQKFESVDVNIRMEVQILDSAYQLYSRPFTRIYFTTYKLGLEGEKLNFEQSDTLSCRNGWGVKLLNYEINNDGEKLILGAACEGYNGSNYREVEIDYPEIERRIDSTGVSNIIKTFAIYYK